MDLEQLLAQILGGGQPNRMAGNWNGPDSEPNRLIQPAPMQQAGPPAAMAPQGAPMAAPQQQPPAAAPQPSGGGFLERLFGGGQGDGENQTIAWLQQQGMDPGTATMYAKNKPALQQYLLKRSQGVDPKDALQAEKLGLEIENLRNPQPGSDWSKMDDGRLFNQRTGETRDVGDPGGGGQFEGSSVEAQSLNYLVKNGQLTADQAAQLGAGKLVTNPGDGSVIFLTPQGVFGQAVPGGPAQPLSPPPASAAPAAAPVDPAAVAPAPPVAPAPVDAAALPAGRPGILPITEGKPGKLATEAETRNRSLYTVAAPDLKIAVENFSALENIYSQAASKILPWGLDNAATSPEYQRARNALTNIIQTYMYSTSGASAPQQEVDRTIAALMPGPNEATASIADKKARLKTMVDAIRQAGGNWKPSDQPAGASTGINRDVVRDLYKSETLGAPAPGGVDPSSATPDSSGWREVAPGVKLRKVN